MHLAREICSAKLPCIAQFEHLSVCNLPPSPPVYVVYTFAGHTLSFSVFVYLLYVKYLQMLKQCFVASWKNYGITRAGWNRRQFDIFDKEISILSVIGYDW
jgi:hypothetical protein